MIMLVKWSWLLRLLVKKILMGHPRPFFNLFSSFLSGQVLKKCLVVSWDRTRIWRAESRSTDHYTTTALSLIDSWLLSIDFLLRQDLGEGADDGQLGRLALGFLQRAWMVSRNWEARRPHDGAGGNNGVLSIPGQGLKDIRTCLNWLYIQY